MFFHSSLYHILLVSIAAVANVTSFNFIQMVYFRMSSGASLFF